MEVVVTTGAISRAKLQSNRHHQQTNMEFFLQAGCPSCHPTNSVKPLKGKYHIAWTCLPQTHLGVFQLCLRPLIAPGYLGGMRMFVYVYSLGKVWCGVWSTASPVSRLRPVLGGMKRSRDDAWFDDDDDDDDDSVPEPKSDVLRGRLDLLEEADEAAANGDNSPGVWILVSLSVLLSECR